MKPNIYWYILVMAGVTYLIRMLPLTLFQKKIQNQFFKDFLYYVPYATLSAMTFPAILYATGNKVSALAGFACALILAYRRKSLIVVSASACAVVFVVNTCLSFAHF